jgi:hypothetical protein
MKRSGNIIIAVIFVVLVSFIGLSLLTFSYMHNKIEGVRTRKTIETGKIRQDLIYYLHHFREKVMAENMADIDTPEIDYFNKTLFPDEKISGTLITNSFANKETQKLNYKKTRIINLITADAAKSNYIYHAEADIDLLSGQIPLTMFPILINKKIDTPTADFLKKENISSKDGKKIVVDDIKTEVDMTGFLKDAIEIDKARALTWEEIREQFGFERSSEPIAEGIHILSEENTVKLIFIQGDVERIVFSINENKQIIGIGKDGCDYELHYKPGEHYCRCWDLGLPEDSLFKEKIVVNGNAWAIEQRGEAAFLKSSNIILFVSHRAIIKSDLVTQGLDLKEIFLSNLLLLSSSQALPGQNSSIEAEVVIDVEEETNIQAAIISDGKVTNHSSKLNLSGSLYTTELENKGEIEATHKNLKSDADSYFVAKDFKYISVFFINFIEEIYNVL